MKTAPKKATRIKAGRIQRANYKWIYLFLLPTIVIFAMFYLMPIAQVFVTSFTKWDGFNAPKFNGLTNYINLFTNSSFLIALKNLLWWCVIALTLHVGFGTWNKVIAVREKISAFTATINSVFVLDLRILISHKGVLNG